MQKAYLKINTLIKKMNERIKTINLDLFHEFFNENHDQNVKHYFQIYLCPLKHNEKSFFSYQKIQMELQMPTIRDPKS